MIQKFRWKFIYMSIASLFIVLIVTMGMLLFVNYHQAQTEVDRVMVALIKNEGHLTPRNAQPAFGNQNDAINRTFLAGRYNPEAVYQYRYFSVKINPKNKIQIINDDNVYQLSSKQVKQITKKILKLKQSEGSIDIGQNKYRYRKSKNKLGDHFIVFLNESLIFAKFWLLLRISLALSLAALFIFALVLISVSRKAIKPIIVTYNKQREFITNAGHELKTPLAIISANTEMEEMLGNDSEWLQSTKDQTERLTQLINRLIALARTGETGELVVGKVNFSKIVKNDAQSFKSVMQKNGLHYEIQINTGIFVRGEEHSLKELVNILLDNACKYCDKDGKVVISLTRSRLGKHAILKVKNTYVDGKGKNYQHFFDRFYRQDESHNSKKSGFGIGLAMAKDIVEAFQGKINVHWKNNMISFVVNLKIMK
ncbi:HAMP domain-containing sensor histidine kinase [Lactobacillus sp.]|uniref:sensor histidine kinase n=1 Tax=Lactobacillus sp. TaxID=1591 RepID=UPI0019BF62B3|nr:HAMP domain-containing sensor histidine kinase [Lactobacillus sp.]MBD5429933.1 HAMP domain-containing histidine kinase [Lactobacillus sp.]